MNLPDLLITGANIIISISLIPQVYHGFKYKVGPIRYGTSIPTVIALYIISFAMWLADLYFSSGITFIIGSLWLILLSQRVIYHSSQK